MRGNALGPGDVAIKEDNNSCPQGVCKCVALNLNLVQSFGPSVHPSIYLVPIPSMALLRVALCHLTVPRDFQGYRETLTCMSLLIT